MISVLPGNPLKMDVFYTYQGNSVKSIAKIESFKLESFVNEIKRRPTYFAWGLSGILKAAVGGTEERVDLA